MLSPTKLIEKVYTAAGPVTLEDLVESIGLSGAQARPLETRVTAQTQAQSAARRQFVHRVRKQADRLATGAGGTQMA